VFVAFDVVGSPNICLCDFTSMPFGVRSIEANCHIFAFRN